MVNESLNNLQQQAVNITSGPVLVSAPPGSGKSRIIVFRVANLIKNGVSPKRIMAATFTRKAARELKERVLELVGPAARDVTCGTFHSICLSLLRRLSDRPVEVVDEAQSRAIVSELLAVRGIPLKAKDVALDISYMKAWMISPEEAFKRSRSKLELELAAVYDKYEKYLEENNVVDFDNIIIEALRLFSNPKLTVLMQSMFDHVLIDEYQDVNYMQGRLVNFLVEKSHNVFAVGDASQAIYGFMGANLNEFKSFPGRYAGCRPIFLDLNYRSKKNIIDISNSLMPGVVPMRPVAEDLGDRAICIYNDNPASEAEFIRTVVPTLQGTTAILVRAGWQLPPITEALSRHGIKYNVIDDTLRSLKDEIHEPLRISIMTMHASKGLEFNNVIITGLEEGILPYKDADDVEEEKRLFYVAITRAKDRLYLLSCLSRDGKMTTTSRFLSMLPKKLVETRRM